jgi:hypothetical protein
MAKAPAGWEYFRPSLTERSSRTLLTLRRDSAVTPSEITTRVTSSQRGPMGDEASNLVTVLEALDIRGGRSSHGSSYRSNFFISDDEDHGDDDDDRDFTACDSECGYCGSCSY